MSRSRRGKKIEMIDVNEELEKLKPRIEQLERQLKARRAEYKWLLKHKDSIILNIFLV